MSQKVIKLESEFYEDITRQVRNGMNKIHELTEGYKKVDDEIRSGNFAGDLLHEKMTERDSLRTAIARERKDRLSVISSNCEEYIEDLKSEDDLDPSLINDTDLKLLTSGIRLTSRDINGMLSRNKDNPTMLQIILRHCEDNGIDTGGIKYKGNDDTIASVKLIPHSAKVCLKYAGGMDDPVTANLYNKIFGEGTGLYDAFMETGE